MDPDVILMYLPDTNVTVTRENLGVKISEQFNRKPMDFAQEEIINTIWHKRMESNPKLWDGTKFRIDSVTCEGNGEKVVWNLGITSYKDFIGTNWSPDANSLQEKGLQNFNNSQAYMSDALGVGAVVKTSDNKIILIRRSAHCGEAVGLLDIPGGHPEPQELVGKITASEIDINSLSENAVVDEIFDSIMREVVDEVNIPMDSLSDPQLIGIARNTTSAGRPSSEYLIECSLDSDTVLNLYNKGNQLEVEESTAIKLIPLSQIPSLQEDKELWKDLAPSCKGCMILYQHFISNNKQR